MILTSSALLAASIGNYANWDTQLEYSAALGVVKWHLPYISYGNFINQPPIGYYIDSLFFIMFGSASYTLGVAVITLFGLGCIFLVYMLGKTLYSTRAGLFAAALLCLTPWHLVISTSFLIDAQCLFFSLLFLLTGIWAIKRTSLKLFLLTGVMFGLASLTKVYAVFMIIPLAIFFLSSKPKKPLKVLGAILLFLLPAFIMNYVWYGMLTNLGITFVLRHDDFTPKIPPGIIPSPVFMVQYFITNLGLALIIACVASLFLSAYRKRLLKQFLIPDSAFTATILAVVGIDTYFVLVQNLYIPYVNVFKYAYSLVPLFCLLAASLFDKLILAQKNTDPTTTKRKITFAIALFSLILVAVSMFQNAATLVDLIKQDHILFAVEGERGYSLQKALTLTSANISWALQGIAFAAIIMTLLAIIFRIQRSSKQQSYRLIQSLNAQKAISIRSYSITRERYQCPHT